MEPESPKRMPYADLPERERARLLDDEDTLYAMGRIFCRAHHAKEERPDGLCAHCRETVEYSVERTRACPKMHKGNCSDCEIHCYKPGMRERIRAIMAYAAPRMPFYHPVKTVRFLRKKLARR